MVGPPVDPTAKKGRPSRVSGEEGERGRMLPEVEGVGNANGVRGRPVSSSNCSVRRACRGISYVSGYEWGGSRAIIC